MSKTCRFLILWMLITGLSCYAQPVFISLNIDESNLSFKGSDKWVATLQNQGSQKLACFLRGSVTVQGEGVIANGISKSFMLGPLETKLVTKQSTELFDSTRFEYSVYYRNALIRTGELPSRRYEFCLKLFDRKTGLQLGENCTILEPQKFLPPSNIFPLSEDTLTNIANTTFQWTALQPLRSNVLYDLEIVEIFGTQEKLTSFFSNPLFFERKGISANSLLYPLSSRKFNPGKRYAWRVVGRAGETRISSEPTAFYFEERGGKAPPKPVKKKAIAARPALLLSTHPKIVEIPAADSLYFKIPRASSRYLSRLVITLAGSSVVEKLISIEPGGSIVSIYAKTLRPSAVYRAMYTDINNQRQIIRFKII